MLNFFKNIASFSLGFLPRIKPVCFIVYVCYIHLIAAQQNLVYNGDFEEYSSCPETFSNPNQSLKEIEKCDGWKAPTHGTSDYFNSCANADSLIGTSGQSVVGTPINVLGSQTPYSGNGYLGGYFTWYTGGAGTDGYNGPGWWEYIQGNLTEPLKIDDIYQLSLKLSVAELSDLMINEIGVFLSNSPISSENTSNLNVTPQCTFYEPNFFRDTTEWIDLKALFIANGGEKFITIGNFKDVYNTDTLRRFNWEPLYVNPNCTYMFVDDVQLVQTDIEIPNVFTPNGDGVNDLIPFPNFGNSANKIVVVNRWGNLIYESNGINPIWDGKDTSGKTCTEGTYFYRINNTNIQGFIQLMR